MKYDAANLLYLIRLCFRTLRLKVEYFLNAVLCEDVMAAADSLGKAKNLQQPAQPGKRDIRIGRALQYLRQKFFMPTHSP